MSMDHFSLLNFAECITEIYKFIDGSLNDEKCEVICAVNANLLIESYRNNEIRKILYNNKMNIADGYSAKLFHNIFTKQKVNLIPGPDLFIDIINKKKYSMSFIGTNDETLMYLKKSLSNYDPRINDMHFESLPYLKKFDNYNYTELAERIKMYGSEIIWIALGAPKQELFAARLKDYLPKGVIIGVGAAFLFYSSKRVKRAPLFLRQLHLEWFYRLLKEHKKMLPRILKNFYWLPKIFIKELIKNN